jgi:hypothetical protein
MMLEKESTLNSASNTPEVIDQSPSIPPFDVSSLPLKHQAFAALKENGLSTTDICKALNYSRSNGTLIDRKLAKAHDLTSSINVSQAAKAHKRILQAFLHPDKVNIPIELKGSDVSRAIDRVYDRAQPVKAQEAGAVNNTWIQVNLGEFK